jgi:cysteine desulfurase/selenocysteine lyase
LEGVSIVGPKDVADRGGITSFTLDNWDTTEIAMHLDETYNIAVRSGMHCVHSWFNSRKIEGTARSSIYLYNNESDVKNFTDAIEDMLSS